MYAFADLVIANVLVRLQHCHDLTDEDVRSIADFLGDADDLALVQVRSGRDGTTWLDDSGDRRLAVAQGIGSTDPISLKAIVIELGARASGLQRRSDDEIGQITVNPSILGNRPIIAGTRIPADAIWEFHVAGFDVEQILAEYPRLTRLDVERAIAFEVQRRHLHQAS